MRLLALLGAASLVPAGPVQIGTGPAGGTVWQVVIPNPAAPLDLRPTVFYLPPGLTAGRRYRVVFFLHGFPGSPYQFVDGLRLAETADTGVTSGRLRPFVAVVPPAGFDVRHGEWSGLWEDYLVRDVVPWADARLLRSLGTRFFLSCGTTRDRATARDTRAFSRELRSLGLPHELWLAPGGHDGSLWRRQLPAALLFALRR